MHIYTHQLKLKLYKSIFITQTENKRKYLQQSSLSFIEMFIGTDCPC